MYLSREAGFYDVNGNAEYIRANEKFPDNHPAVKACPQIFDKISNDAPPPRKAKVAGSGSEV